MSTLVKPIPVPRFPVWVVVADGAKARILVGKTGRGAFEKEEVQINPEARKHGRDLVTDAPGRVFDSAGQGRHGMEPPTDPKDAVEESFARELAERLHQGALEDAYEKLYVIATPVFLGYLRKHYTDAIRQRLAGEIDKDLTAQDAEAIRAALPEIL